MRLVVACLGLGISLLHAQVCVPARILPSGSASGTIDNFSCYLADATAYNAYRLDLPTRGTLQVGFATSAANFILMRVADPDRVFGALQRRGILVKNVSASHPLLAGCLRATVGTPQENDAFLRALEASLSNREH